MKQHPIRIFKIKPNISKYKAFKPELSHFNIINSDKVVLASYRAKKIEQLIYGLTGNEDYRV